MAIRRWIPTLSMMAVSTISYIDRSTLAVLIPTIMRDTGMNATEYGWVVAGFSWGYMLGNPVWGRWLDRIGVRVGMLMAVGLWTLASTAHAWAAGFWGFLIARCILGFGEGATFPGALRTTIQTLPLVSRSRGIALSYSGGSLGAIVTPFVVTPVFQFYGWQAAFLFTGLIGALWLAWWWFSVSKQFDSSVEFAAEPVEPVSMKDPRIWAYIAAYSLGNVPLGFVLYTTSIYLTKVFRLTQTELAWYLWIPPLGWEAGYFFWGWVLDRELPRSKERLTMYRRLFLAGLALTIPFAAASLAPTPAAVIAIYFVVMFGTGAFIIPAVSYATAVFGSRQSSFIGGLGAGSFSLIHAILMPGFGKLFDRGEFAFAFYLAMGFPALGLLLWQWLNRGRPLGPAPKLVPVGR